MKHTLLFLALLALLVAFLHHQFPDALERQGSGYQLLYSTLLLIFIGSGVIAANRSHWRQNMKYAIYWVAIFLVIMVGYTYRDVFLGSKLAAELIPGTTTVEGDGSITLHARADGHFYVTAKINGQDVLFMIDTGASDIMLTRQTANRIGLAIHRDAKKQIYSTANGVSAGLEVELDRMHVGPITMRHVTAYVNQGETDMNLLGQSFMNRLSSYSVEDGEMTLVP